MSTTGFNWGPDHPRLVGDLTGDGRADIVGFGKDGVWVALNNGNGTFQPPRLAVANFGFNQGWRVDQHPRFLADLTGDGRADIVGFGNDGVWTALNNGNGTFQVPKFVVADLGVKSGWRVDQHPRFVADVTGDGRADLVGFGGSFVWVARSNGNGAFQAPRNVMSDLVFQFGWRVDQHPRFVTDLTGDRLADLLGFGDEGVTVALGSGSGNFQPPRLVLAHFGVKQGWRADLYPRLLADLTGDRRADIVGFGDEGVWVALNNGDGTFQEPVFALKDFGLNSVGLAPASILSITPIFPDSVPNMVVKRDSLLSSLRGTFPEDIAREWVQPLAPEEDYDDLLVSCSGWMVNPHDVGGDFPFAHPFGVDWEFSLALDKPPNAAGAFDYLLTPGNKVDSGRFSAGDQSEQLVDENLATALQLDFPQGLLGVEIDGGNVPEQFKQNVASGNRVAVFGRWIVDTGHPTYRGEVHPPLLMASASVTAPETTKAIFTSRPYLVSQIYTTDIPQPDTVFLPNIPGALPVTIHHPGSVYKDSAGNDGTFYRHLIRQIIEVNETILGFPTKSILVECHPKITENPMRGAHLLRCQVRPPPRTGGLAGLVATNAALKHLVVSFHFTVRSGVGVQLISSAADTVDVLIVLNSAGYKAPPLPPNAGKRYSRAELAAQNERAGERYLQVEIGSGLAQALNPAGSIINSATVLAIFGRGVQGDVYESQTSKVDPLATQGAVVNVPAGAIPPNAGITVDDTQPYPVTGWIEVKWAPSVLHT